MSTEQTILPPTLEMPLMQVPRLEEIVQSARLQPSDEAYSITCRGVEALVAQLRETGHQPAKVSSASLDDIIARIDHRLSLQVDEILHDPQFQKLESSWRSLRFLVDRIDFM